MDQLTNFLNNLRPGGSSQVPKSKFEQKLTYDSDLDSSEQREIKDQPIVSETANKINKNPKLGLIKKFTDVPHESPEFAELSSEITFVSQLTENDLTPIPVPRKSIVHNLNNSENDNIEKLWENLNIGENGYITNKEFEYSCLVLELDDLNKEVLESHFKKSKDDNHISLLEFSAGLKEYEKLQGKRIQSIRLGSYISSGLFTTLDPTNKGFCKNEKIIELWSSEGLLNGIQILKHFNMDKNNTIELISLSTALDKSINTVESDPIIRAGIISYRKELTYCRFIIKKLDAKLKMKSKIQHSDQEIEMLKKKNEEYTFLSNQLGEDKAILEDQCKELNQEISTLEIQCVQLKVLNTKLEKSNSELRKEVEEIKNIHKEKLEVSSNSQEKENELFLALNKINEFEEDNQKKKFQISDLEEKNKKIQNENGILLNKIANFTTKMEIAINREKEYQRKMKEKDIEINKVHELKNQLHENQKDLLIQKYEYEDKLYEQSNQIENIMKEKENNLVIMESKLKFLENQMHQFQQLKLELDRCQNDKRSKQDVLNKLEEANDRLSISIKNAISKLELLSRKDSELHSNQLIIENIQFHKENLLLQDEINTLKKSGLFQPSTQTQSTEKDVKYLQMQVNQKNVKIDELENKIKNEFKDSSTSSSDQKRSLKKYDFLQFQYDELNKKYGIQMEQVEKTDEILKELYEGNTKLLQSLRQMELQKEKAEMNVLYLEEKVKTLQNLLNRETKS